MAEQCCAPPFPRLSPFFHALFLPRRLSQRRAPAPPAINNRQNKRGRLKGAGRDGKPGVCVLVVQRGARQGRPCGAADAAGAGNRHGHHQQASASSQRAVFVELKHQPRNEQASHGWLWVVVGVVCNSTGTRRRGCSDCAQGKAVCAEGRGLLNKEAGTHNEAQAHGEARAHRGLLAI